jgi:DNA-binding CsgD family transcriptional regulator
MLDPWKKKTAGAKGKHPQIELTAWRADLKANLTPGGRIEGRSINRGTAKAVSPREPLIGLALEKPLLSLHRAVDTESLWKAVQEVVDAALPGSLIGLTLQHNPIVPMLARWTRPMADGLCSSKPIQDYLDAHPRSKFVRVSDVFPVQSKLLESEFYLRYMAPQKCPYAVGMFFWNGPRLVAVVVIMRTNKQGELTDSQMDLLGHLYPQFQTALRRLGLQEREHSARIAFEEFLSRLPLPTILLRWNLKLLYQNQAGREFCALWERGPELAPVMKLSAPIPAEILVRCRTLKQRWEKSARLNVAQAGVKQETVHHPKWTHLRATINLKELSSQSVARPHFLIECEELRSATASQREPDPNRLSHLVRLTRREQEVARLVCDGRSNREIADSAGMSLATVKKHLYVIFRKLEVSSRSRLMALMQ